MSVQETNLAAIANAIRQKEGTTEPIPAADFAPRILALPSSGLPENVRTITVTSSDPEMGTVSGGGVASDGMELQVSAESKNGYYFADWRESGKKVSEDINYSFEVQGDRELTANFSQWEYVAGRDWHNGNSIIGSCNQIAFGNGLFVACGTVHNYVMYSTDGISWERATLPEQAQTPFVSFCKDRFFLFQDGVSDIAYSSADGVTWQKITLPASAYWASAAYGNGVYVAVATHNMVDVAYSLDGVLWNYVALPEAGWRNVVFGNGKFMASDAAVYFISTDGINWEKKEIPFTEGHDIIANAIFQNGLFIAKAIKELHFSSDGETWQSTPFPEPDANITDVTPVYGSGIYIAPVYDSSIFLSSPDLIQWEMGGLPSKAMWGPAAYGNNRFIITAYESSNIVVSYNA